MFATTPSCSLRDMYGNLPPDSVPNEVNLDQVANAALGAIEDLRKELLADDAIWRDWLSLSGTGRTFCGAEDVFRQWSKCVASKRIEKLELKRQMVMRPCPGTSWVSIGVTFNTVQDNGLTGYHTCNVGLVPDGHGGWKVWTIATILETFQGYGHPDEPQIEPSERRSLGPQDVDYPVVIVGGGQCGIGLAGRLKAVDVPALVIEKGPSVGQTWSNNYDNLRQHTLRDYGSLPFGPTWSAQDEVFLTGKVVADGYGKFVDKYRLEVWTSTEATSCTRDDEAQTWTTELVTRSANEKMEMRTVKSRILVVATGAGFTHVRPLHLPGYETFKGTIMPQDKFRNAKDFAGKRAIVIGSGTSGHDIAQNCLNYQMNVTMLQRSKTPVYPVEWLDNSLLWNRNMPTAVSDRIGASGPYKVLHSFLRRNHVNFANEPKWQKFYADLEKVGFRVDRETFLSDIFCSSRYGGMYIDVGTSQHIIDGDIKVKSGIPIRNLTENGILFEDAEELTADLIVTATGHESDFRKVVAPLIGEEMAGNLPEFWGMTKNGDHKGFMRESRPGLWLFGGNAPMARWMSRFIALQIMLGLDGVNNVID